MIHFRNILTLAFLANWFAAPAQATIVTTITTPAASIPVATYCAPNEPGFAGNVSCGYLDTTPTMVYVMIYTPSNDVVFSGSGALNLTFPSYSQSWVTSPSPIPLTPQNGTWTITAVTDYRSPSGSGAAANFEYYTCNNNGYGP